MGAGLRPSLVFAAWFRRPRPRAFVRALGALFAAVRAQQYAGLYANFAGANVSHAAPTNVAQRAQTFSRDDAEIHAAQ